MFDKESIKGILFDYGGTIDTNGVHWAEVFWNNYVLYKVPVTKSDFNEAYVHAERTLGRNPIIKPHHNFYDLLLIKTGIQLEYLVNAGKLANNDKKKEYQTDITERCYSHVKDIIKKAYPTLEYLYNKYPIVLVSNFYGNIGAVLKDFGIDHFFKSIVESAVVGVRKPDYQIFTLGVKELGLDAKNTVVIGDSYSKDIEPGKKAGCQTIWLKVSSWDGEEESEENSADFVINDLKKLINIF